MTVVVATTDFDGIGIDLEHIDWSDRKLAEKVLTGTERSRPGELDGPGASFVTEHFALKEAIYKAAPNESQEGMEFQDIELVLPRSILVRERVWEHVPARVADSAWRYDGHIFLDGPWLLAIATRSKVR